MLYFRFQTPGTIVFTWDPPKRNEKNGNIVGYNVLFSKNVVLNNDYKFDRNITNARVVFNNVEENMDYTFKVKF